MMTSEAQRGQTDAPVNQEINPPPNFNTLDSRRRPNDRAQASYLNPRGARKLPLAARSPTQQVWLPAANGADIVAIDIAGPRSPASNAVPASPEELEEAPKMMRAFGRRADTVRADIRDIAALRRIADETIRSSERATRCRQRGHPALGTALGNGPFRLARRDRQQSKRHRQHHSGIRSQDGREKSSQLDLARPPGAMPPSLASYTSSLTRRTPAKRHLCRPFSGGIGQLEVPERVSNRSGSPGL
jgi:hypothetical protein